MAINVYDREYAKWAAGATAFCDELSRLYPWDETSGGGTSGGGTLTKYLDEEHKSYIRLDIYGQGSNRHYAVSLNYSNGATSSSLTMFSATEADTPDSTYTQIVQGPDFLAFAAGPEKLPSSNDVHTALGLFPCTNAVTGAQSVCVALCSSEWGFKFYSPTTASGTSDMYQAPVTGAQLDVVAPLCSDKGHDVADSVYLLTASTEAVVNTAGRRIFAGAEWYKLMGLMLPAGE